MGSTAVEGKVSLMLDLPRPKRLYVQGHTTSKLRLLILEAVVTLPLGSPGKIIQGTDSEDEGEIGGQQGPVVVRLVENEAEEYETDSGEEEEWWHPEVKQGEKVQVFFTRNGKIIGKKEVMLPKGGFYPTVGMMSSQEKVRVELKPLSG